MPKLSPLTDEDICAVADAMKARGETVRSAGQLRKEMVATFPPETVIPGTPRLHEALTKWRNAQPKAESAPEEELSPALLQAVQLELRARASRAAAEFDEQREALQADLDDIARHGRVQEAELQRLLHECTARTSERDEATGALLECRDNLARALVTQREATDRQEAAAKQLAGVEADRNVLLTKCQSLESALSTSEQLALDLKQQLDAALEREKAAVDRALTSEALAAALQSQVPRTLVSRSSRAAAGQALYKFTAVRQAHGRRKT